MSMRSSKNRLTSDRTVIAGAPVIRISAPWLKKNPWVWKCQDCGDGFIAAENRVQATSAAIYHRDLAHK